MAKLSDYHCGKVIQISIIIYFRCPVAGCSNSTPLDMNDMAYEYELWKFIQDKAKPDFTSSSSTSEMEDKS